VADSPQPALYGSGQPVVGTIQNNNMRIEFIFPENPDFEGLETYLAGNLRLRPEHTRTVRRTYYDSFDWRLYLGNTLLEDSHDGKLHTLALRTLDGADRCHQIQLDTVPRFARDIPGGPLRQFLEPVLEMRELVPRVMVRCVIRTLRILNRDEKTVARLAFEANTLPRRQGTRSGKPECRVVLIPVRGYRKNGDQVAGYLQERGLVPAPAGLLQTSLALLGEVPGTYSSKPVLQLDPAMRADHATRLVLHRLLDIMLQNEAGVRTGTDTEFLHDFRVAIRRTRSALSQIKRVFPKRTVDRYTREFAWLGQVTSPLRDLDVYLLHFDDYRTILPADMRADIEPLRDFLAGHRETSQRALLRALDSARYRRLTGSWRSLLEQPVNERTRLENAGRPVIEVACERIWRTYRRILRKGAAITTDTPATALHELRKDCKKLRYLMEFFQSLFPAKKITALIRTLKLLQDNLGRFQDYEVQVTSLQQYSRQMAEEGMAGAGTLMAMGMLIDGLKQRQRETRREFAERFETFSVAANHARFRKLFRGCTGAVQGDGL